MKRFVFASSLEAIGPVARKDAPAVEDTEPHPVSQYGLSKLRAEQKVMSFSGRSITCQVLRLGNVYGPGSGFLVPAMADAIRKKGELARLRSVWQDFLYNPVYVDDAAAILAACSLEERGTNGIYNIGGNQVLTLGELHELIAGVIGRDAPAAPVNGFLKLILGLRTKMLRAAGLCDTMTYILSGDKGRDHRAVSIRRAAAELGYAPAVSLEQGIRRTLE